MPQGVPQIPQFPQGVPQTPQVGYGPILPVASEAQLHPELSRQFHPELFRQTRKPALMLSTQPWPVHAQLEHPSTLWQSLNSSRHIHSFLSDTLSTKCN